jgi:adenine-specific DNA-methyltransferase
LYDEKNDLLFLVEAVTTHGPLSAKRQAELEVVLKNCSAKRIYLSAFPDLTTFKKYIGNIAWDTEVWIADNPDHMIHFNGPKFFNVYNE